MQDKHLRILIRERILQFYLVKMNEVQMNRDRKQVELIRIGRGLDSLILLTLNKIKTAFLAEPSVRVSSVNLRKWSKM